MKSICFAVISSVTLICISYSYWCTDRTITCFCHTVDFLIFKIFILIIEFNCIISLTQLEVSIICMLFIYTIAILAGYKCRCVAYMLCAVINSPVVKYICTWSCCCGRTCGCACISFYSFCSRGNCSHSCAVWCDCIVNDYFVFFPNSKQIFIRLFFVGCDLSCGCSICSSISGTCPNKEICCCAALCLCPAFECISYACRSRGININGFVDLDSCIAAIKSTFSVILAAIVAVPVDMCRCFFFLILIYSFQLYCIIIISAFDYSAWSYNFSGSSVCNLCVAFLYTESLARKYFIIGVLIFWAWAVPVLYHPVIKYFIGRRSRCRACFYSGVIFIKCCIRRCIVSAICDIDNTNSFWAYGYCAPACIKIIFLSDPETVSGISLVILYVWIPCCSVTKFIHRISHMGSFVIRSCYCAFVQRHSFGKCMGQTFVCIPSEEFVSCTCSGRHTYLSAVGYTEVHILTFRTPVKSRVCSCIGMKEYTVLDLSPFSIYIKTAFRHCCEIICVCTCAVYVPAFKYIPFGSCRHVIVIAISVVWTNVCSVYDIINYMKLSAVIFF